MSFYVFKLRARRALTWPLYLPMRPVYAVFGESALRGYVAVVMPIIRLVYGDSLRRPTP